jgi:hypothetical protein
MLNDVKVNEEVAGTTIWDIALRFGNSELLKQVMGCPEFTGLYANSWGNTFLSEALSVQRYYGNKELQSIILEYVANTSIDVLKNEGQIGGVKTGGPLGVAICCENEDVVRGLLARGFSLLGERDMLQRTPLENLIIHRFAYDIDFVRECLENIDGDIPLNALRAISTAGLIDMVKIKK